MNAKVVEWLARIAEAQMKVQGMLAANVERFNKGLGDAYGEEHFFAKADLMKQLADEAKAAADAEKAGGDHAAA